MKFYYKIGITLVVAIFIWFLLQNKTENTSKINTVSLLQTSHYDAQSKPKTIKKNKTAKLQANNELIEQDKALIAEGLKKLTYIELYEKSLDLNSCLGYIQHMEQKKGEPNKSKNTNNSNSLIEEYNQNIVHYSSYRQQHATDKQLTAYQEHIENCKTIITQVESLYNDREVKLDSFYYVRTKIKTLMQETQAKSEEEKILKSILERKEPLNKLLDELVILKKGKPKVAEDVIIDLTIEIDELSWEISSVNLASKEVREQKNVQNMEIILKQKRAYLASLHEFDKQAYDSKAAELLSLIADLEKQLSSNYPRVFKEIFDRLNFKTNKTNALPAYYINAMRKKSSLQIPVISEQILESIPINNKDYFNQLLQPALDLYLCYLGQDCGLPHNRKLAMFCFMPPDFYTSVGGLYFEACDMDLDRFYFNHYLTENQAEDLSMIFDYLVENYAK